MASPSMANRLYLFVLSIKVSSLSLHGASHVIFVVKRDKARAGCVVVAMVAMVAILASINLLQLEWATRYLTLSGSLPRPTISPPLLFVPL